MGRRQQRTGTRKMPTLDAADLIRVLKAAGWCQVSGTKHLAYEHPTKSGKVNIDEKWEHVKVGSWTLKFVLEQAGMTRDEFVDLYWRTR